MVTEPRRIIRASIMEHKLEAITAKNIFCLPGAIDGQMSITLLVDLLYQRLVEPTREPMWVIINSPGGMLDQGLAIYDTLKMMAETGVQVNTVAIGDVASMAVTILQAGTRRYSFPNTQFTVHQARLTGGGDSQEVNELIENARELVRLNSIVLKVVAERVDMPIDHLLELSKKTDLSMDTKAALAFGKNGLIDEVITCLPFMKLTA